MTEFERPTSSLDEDAEHGSQGEVDPGSEGDFGGEPMSDEAPADGGTEGGLGSGSADPEDERPER